MAPSIAETVSNAADTIHEKVAAVSLKEVKDDSVVKSKDASAPAVQEPVSEKVKVDDAPKSTVQESTPAVKTQHKEPLKLSGALDAFESFDVTPVIGREFSGVNLAEWLRAPNTDELLRDLAITSKTT